jgi:integrase
MIDQPIARKRSTKKKDSAPRGVFRHPSGDWAIRFTCGGGHVHEQKISRVKRDAMDAHAARRLRARQQSGWCPTAERADARARLETDARQAAPGVTVRDYGDRWLKEHVGVSCKPRTRELYTSVFTRHVYPALGDLPLADVTRERLRELLATKAGTGLSRATLSNILIPVRAMLNAAVDDGRIPGNPAVRLGRYSRGLTERDARTVSALTAKELSAVLGAALEHYPDHADVLHVLAWTGLRLGEACGLQWGDLDVSGGFLEVQRAIAYREHRVLIGAPKSGQARRVDVPVTLVARLRERRSIREAEAAVAGGELAPWIFPALTDDAKPLNPAHLRFKVWYPVLKHAELRNIRLHDLRHTYASLLLQAGEPIAYVKEQLGHSSIQVTVDLYGHFVPGANRGAVDRLAAATTSTKTPRNLNLTWTSMKTAERAKTRMPRKVVI